MTLTRAVIEDDPTVARWDLARIADADGSVDPVIQGLDPWVEFLRGGRLVGNTGCGAFLGSYVVNDGTVRISDLAYRLESCSEQARAQAARLIDTLGEITDFKVLPAGLALQDDLGTTRLALIPDVDLGRRTWTPVAIYDVDGEIAWGESELNTSAVKFTGTAAEGRTICRAFKAESLRSGLAVNVSDIRLANKGACPVSRAKNPTPLQDIEDDFLGALREAASHALRGDELELKGVSGATLMRLRPQADLVGPTWVLDWMDVSPKSGKSTIRRPIEGTTITASFEDIEVVLGETGAVDRNEVNVYTADYRTPAATRLQIGKPTPQGRACAGNKAKSKKCKQQREYLKTLPATDSYIVLDDSLRLLRGTRAIMRFVPESLGAEPESDS